MDAKVIENNEHFSIEQIEYDPNVTCKPYLGKIINKQNKTLVLVLENEINIKISSKSQETFISGQDDGIWIYILNKKYTYFFLEDRKRESI